MSEDMTPIYCSECGGEYEELDAEENVWGCPKHDDLSQYEKRCRGCWKIKDCLLHHVSYIPEVAVPMCNECHVELHKDTPFLSHLQPDMSRREAEEKVDGMLQIGVTEFEGD